MISEGSCDTEVMAADISFDITEINYLLKYIKIYIFLFFILIFHNIPHFWTNKCKEKKN